MFFEGWFRIGDTVAIDPLHVNGVVEAVSLRSLTIRSITGEMIHVPNSQVSMLRVIPRGYRDVEVEIFTTDLEAGEALIDRSRRSCRSARPGSCSGPRSSRPRRSTSACTGSPPTARSPWDGEWLAEDLLPTLIRERAGEGLLVHGPIVTYLDENAQRSFARAIRTRAKPRRGASAGPTDPSR